MARKLGNVIYDKVYKSMKIAVTYENGQIFQHFGHTEQFKVYDVEDGKIVSKTILPNTNTLKSLAKRIGYSL